MNRDQLAHIARAAANIVDLSAIVVIGSQAVLASVGDDAPPGLLESMEADVFPLDRPDLAEVIDGAIGEGSPFHDTFGYYAHGVGPETAVLPAGWRERLVRWPVPGSDAVALCLEVHDLAVAKLVAGRDKDLRWLAVLASTGVVDDAVLAARIDATQTHVGAEALRARWARISPSH